jgi:glycosyltransferase involved in cell wall biosynthesis
MEKNEKMENEYPIISIVIPVYNAEKYIRNCINSLINQTFSNIEIVCVNDGSVDSSRVILEEYANLDNRIIIINQENLGVSTARNNGIRKSRGKYIMFVDSDDWLDLETCEFAYDIALKYSADVVMWSYIREYEGISKPKVMSNYDFVEFCNEDVKVKLHRFLVGPFEKELSKPENMEALNPIWAKLYKTSLIKDNDIELYDIKKIGTGEDGLFNLQLFKYVKKAVMIKKNFYHYRKTNSMSLTTVYSSKKYSQWQHLFDIMQNYIQDDELDETYNIALNNRVALSIITLGLDILVSNKSILGKIKEIKWIISTERYRNAYKKLEQRYFPIHWRLFFIFAKLNFATGIYILLCCMKKIRGK